MRYKWNVDQKDEVLQLCGKQVCKGIAIWNLTEIGSWTWDANKPSEIIIQRKDTIY